MANRSLIVGVTGGIGSGKSIVCKIFKLLGTPVYDADTQARWLMTHDSVLIRSIIEAFGKESYRDGQLNREYLAKLVFPDPEKLNILNSLTHPAVARDFEKWVKERPQFPFLVKEAALFIESGSYKQLDKLILVTAPEQVRIDRVQKRDPRRSEQEIRQVIQRQLSDEQKRQYAHYEIVNDDKTPILPRIIELDQTFRSAII